MGKYFWVRRHRGDASYVVYVGTFNMLAIVQRQYKVCDDTDAQILRMNANEVDRHVRWTQICSLDLTNATTRTEVGVCRSDDYYPLGGSAAPSAGDAVTSGVTVDLEGDWVPYAKFVGATESDELILVATGYFVE